MSLCATRLGFAEEAVGSKLNCPARGTKWSCGENLLTHLLVSGFIGEMNQALGMLVLDPAGKHWPEAIFHAGWLRLARGKLMSSALNSAAQPQGKMQGFKCN